MGSTSSARAIGGVNTWGDWDVGDEDLGAVVSGYSPLEVVTFVLRTTITEAVGGEHISCSFGLCWVVFKVEFRQSVLASVLALFLIASVGVASCWKALGGGR